jgi:hypothetical protein
MVTIWLLDWPTEEFDASCTHIHGKTDVLIAKTWTWRFIDPLYQSATFRFRHDLLDL